MKNEELIVIANELSTVYQRITCKPDLSNKCKDTAEQVLDKISKAVEQIKFEQNYLGLLFLRANGVYQSVAPALTQSRYCEIGAFI